MDPNVIHLICTFITFCTGGSCGDYNPMEINLRFQEGREFGEFWISPENALFPQPTFINTPGEPGFDPRTHIFVPSGLGPPYMISLSPDHDHATLTTHLTFAPNDADGANGGATSSDGTCRPAEDGA